MSLPVTGQSNWGLPLNDYISNDVLAVANQALTAINTHTSATDPHGDRAYAAGLVSPITTGVNLPNGYVVLNSFGQISASMLPNGSGLSNYYDAKADYNATGNGSTDDSTALQNALNACATAGGGEVWVGDGVFCIGTQLVIGANTWLHLSPGAKIKRVIPIVGAAPSVMISNVSFTAGPPATPSTGNILISGGEWDAVGSSLNSACTPILLVQASFASIIQTFFNGVAGNPMVELNGCTYATLRDNVFTGSALGTASGVPAVRLNSTSTTTTPAGMASGVYNNTVCSQIMVSSCTLVITASFAPVGKLLGSDLYSAPYSHDNVTVTGCGTPGGIYATQPQADFVHTASGAAFGNQFNTSGAEIVDLTTTGQVFVGPSAATGTPPKVYVSGNLTYATGYSGAFTGETWHRLAIPGGWSDHSTTGADGFRYKLLPFNTVMLQADMQAPGSAPSDGTQVATMPVAYTPTLTEGVLDLATSNLTNAQSAHMVVQTDRSVKVWGISGGAVIQGTAIYPLD